MEHTVPHASSGTSGHEQREANVKLILYSTFGMIVMVIVVCALMVWMFNALNTQRQEEEHRAMHISRPAQLPPAPRLEEHPFEEIKGIHAHENELLNTYGWSDAKAGVVHIPIERAMDLVLERGLPLTAAAAGTPAAATKKSAKGNATK